MATFEAEATCQQSRQRLFKHMPCLPATDSGSCASVKRREQYIHKCLPPSCTKKLRASISPPLTQSSALALHSHGKQTSYAKLAASNAMCSYHLIYTIAQAPCGARLVTTLPCCCSAACPCLLCVPCLQNHGPESPQPAPPCCASWPCWQYVQLRLWPAWLPWQLQFGHLEIGPLHPALRFWHPAATAISGIIMATRTHVEQSLPQRTLGHRTAGQRKCMPCMTIPPSTMT